MAGTVQFTTASDRTIRLGMVALGAAAAVYPIAHVPLACPLRSMTGIPCPFCGMSRAVSSAVHGHVGASLAFNPGGIFIVLFAAMLLVRPQLARTIRPPVWLLAILLVALWIWNIGYNPTFHQLLLH